MNNHSAGKNYNNDEKKKCGVQRQKLPKKAKRSGPTKTTNPKSNHFTYKYTHTISHTFMICAELTLVAAVPISF